MKVLVYVEGPSDKAALEALLQPIIRQGRDLGVGISFHPQGSKSSILDNVPRIAADHLADRPGHRVIALPDLYPMRVYKGTKNEHGSPKELERLLRDRFLKRAKKSGVAKEVLGYFLVYCLKHDLEALILASPAELRQRLGTKDALKGAWRKPVEDQDDDEPPKRVVERLFKKYKKRKYRDTVDAPWILDQADLSDVERECAQQFALFVAKLRKLVDEAREEQFFVASKYRGTDTYYKVRSKLIKVAKNQDTITYQNVAQIAGLPQSGNYMANEIGHILGEISEDEHADGRPMLSVVVVDKAGNLGPGFFTLAKALGKLASDDDNDKQQFADKERKAVYSTWCSSAESK